MAGKLMVGIGHTGEFADNQQQDDDQSLTFNTAPLENLLDIVGQPKLHLNLSSDQPVANIIARLCDVHPTGESTLITYGVLNLTHRNSNESPEALVPGKKYEIELTLNHIAYQLPPGHQLRLSVSNVYWPLIWPSPYRDTLSIRLAESRLSLPVKSSFDAITNPALDEFDPVIIPEGKELRPPQTKKSTTEDSQTGNSQIKTAVDYGHYLYPSCETEIDFKIDQLLSIHPDDPNSATSTSRHHVKMQQGEIATALESRYEMTCSDSQFFIKASWRAWEGNECIFEKEFDYKIKRNLV